MACTWKIKDKILNCAHLLLNLAELLLASQLLELLESLGEVLEEPLLVLVVNIHPLAERLVLNQGNIVSDPPFPFSY